jgi:hypothetical protein
MYSLCIQVSRQFTDLIPDDIPASTQACTTFV